MPLTIRSRPSCTVIYFFNSNYFLLLLLFGCAEPLLQHAGFLQLRSTGSKAHGISSSEAQLSSCGTQASLVAVHGLSRYTACGIAVP